MGNNSTSDVAPGPGTPSKGPKMIKEQNNKVVFKDKKEAMEALKDLLREKNVPSTANWETALKMVSIRDPSEPVR